MEPSSSQAQEPKQPDTKQEETEPEIISQSVIDTIIGRSPGDQNNFGTMLKEALNHRGNHRASKTGRKRKQPSRLIMPNEDEKDSTTADDEKILVIDEAITATSL